MNHAAEAAAGASGQAAALAIGLLALAGIAILRWQLDRRQVARFAETLRDRGARVTGTRAFPNRTTWGRWRGREFETSAAQVLLLYRTVRTVSLRLPGHRELTLRMILTGSGRPAPRLNKVESGDPLFDRHWETWTNDETTARRILENESLRMHLATVDGRLDVAKGWARFSEPTGRFHAEEVVDRLDLLDRLAHALE